MDLQNCHFGLDDLQHFRHHHGGVRCDAAGGGKFQRHHQRQHTGERHRAFHVAMLNQANGDRQILAKQLNISPHQLSYVTHSGEGEGLLFFGNVILPFVDHFPKDLELYRILTTRLSEVAEAQKHE